MATLLAVAGPTVLTACARGASNAAPLGRRSVATRLAARSGARSGATTVVGRVLARDDEGITVDEGDDRYANVRTDSHTILTISSPTRASDIAVGDHVVVIGTLTGSVFAAHALVDQGRSGAPSLAASLSREIAGRSGCRVTAGTVRSRASGTSITVTTGSGARIVVTTTHTRATRETAARLADLTPGETIAVSGSPDPYYANVLLAERVRVRSASASQLCGEP